MIRVNVLCEGKTEVLFVEYLLEAYFSPMDVFLTPFLLGKPGHKGGNVNFDRIFTDTRKHLLGDSTAYCTTFFDFYGLPADFPGKAAASKHSTIKDKANAVCDHLTSELKQKLGDNPMRRFIPYVQMYEFEALLFSDTDKFATGIGNPAKSKDFQKVCEECETPEHINDNPNTAPSKRIKKLVSGYEKPVAGLQAAKEIGLATIRSKCLLFDAWLQKLEALKT